MRNNRTTYLIILFTIFIFSCKNEKNKRIVTELDNLSVDSLRLDTIQREENLNYKNRIKKDLYKQIELIRLNFKQINSIHSWDNIIVKELWETVEGGEAKYFYKGGKLKKIITRQFGDTFQLVTEYYLKNGELSFVFEKLYQYNEPIDYKKIDVEVRNEVEIYDLKKVEIVEIRSYFENQKMLKQLNSQDTDLTSFLSYLLEEQMRIKMNFGKLMKLES